MVLNVNVKCVGFDKDGGALKNGYRNIDASVIRWWVEIEKAEEMSRPSSNLSGTLFSMDFFNNHKHICCHI